tara:strand:- start:339 stop:497 length:159 start_codon:yes stop_codon:yes gene_type:complete
MRTANDNQVVKPTLPRGVLLLPGLSVVPLPGIDALRVQMARIRQGSSIGGQK